MLLLKNIVDKQELFFLEKNQWNCLINQGNYNNIEMIDSYHNRLVVDLDLFTRYNELCLTLGFIGKENWLPYMLLKINSIYQRVDISKRKCQLCDWQGLVGIPTILDLYIGVPKTINKFDLVKKSLEIKKKSCPRCKKDGFKEHVIWVENFSQLPLE